MHSNLHITVEMLDSVLEQSFTDSPSQFEKETARHLHELLKDSRLFHTVLFDIGELARGRNTMELAKIAFLVGMQSGYELGVSCPPAP
jgi:hypothetical protein